MAQAQDAKKPPLNKQETLDYIVKLYNSDKGAINRAYIENRLLVLESNGHKDKYEIIDKKLEIIKDAALPGIFAISNGTEFIFLVISAEIDAKRLKKALEHLSEFAKLEKSTDPFDN